MRIGVDVGDTHTDAVLMAGAEIVHVQKIPAGDNAIDDVLFAIRAILRNACVRASEIDTVAIGTTQFSRAFRERRGLARVGVLRFDLPAAPTIAPLSHWPADLLASLDPIVETLPSGYELHGRAVARLDPRELFAAVDSMRQQGVRSLAISCTTQSTRRDLEQRAASLLRLAFPDVHVTLGSEIGRGGAGPLERENAAIVNAALVPMAREAARTIGRELWRLDLNASIFICQNDGTLMDAHRMARFPVLTFAAGAAHSLRGAAYLSGRSHACVVDVGGTRTFVGVLANGFPRESRTGAMLDGVRAAFRMPELCALGVGGASIVTRDANGVVTVGPGCVRNLMTDALVFGGGTITATDVAVAAGLARIGDRTRVAGLPEGLVRDALSIIQWQVDAALDLIRSSAPSLPVVLVGGGTSLVLRPLSPLWQVAAPTHHAVAGAVGAATGLVSGEVERVYSYKKLSRADALNEARDGAITVAVDAGALRETVEVTEITETPVEDPPGHLMRLRARAAGRAPG